MKPGRTCPSCRLTVPAPDDSGSGPVLCPRCRRAVRQGAVRPALREVQARGPAGLPLATTACPHCGRMVPALCLFCPQCEEAIREPHPGGRPGTGDPEEGLSQPLSRGTVALAVLGWLTVIGVSAAAARGPGWGGAGAMATSVLILLGILGATVLLIAASPLGGSGGAPPGTWLRVHTEVLALVGGLAVVALVVSVALRILRLPPP